MNDYTTLLIATGRMDDRLREAERDRLAALVARPSSDGGSVRFRLRRLLRPAGVAGSRAAEPRPAPSTLARPC